MKTLDPANDAHSILIGDVGKGMIFGWIFKTRQTPEMKKLKEIRRLNADCRNLFRRFYGKIEPVMRKRIEKIFREVDELVDFCQKNEMNGIRLKIVEQSLKLVMAYVNLAYNYCVRVRELSPARFQEINDRINRNHAKLGHLKNYQAVLDLTKSIEMDERLLKSMLEEKAELEQTSVRLEYIESTIGTFKHQFISNDCDDPAVEEIEHVINEATALDNVLSARRKTRI